MRRWHFQTIMCMSIFRSIIIKAIIQKYTSSSGWLWLWLAAMFPYYVLLHFSLDIWHDWYFVFVWSSFVHHKVYEHEQSIDQMLLISHQYVINIPSKSGSSLSYLNFEFLEKSTFWNVSFFLTLMPLDTFWTILWTSKFDMIYGWMDKMRCQ